MADWKNRLGSFFSESEKNDDEQTKTPFEKFLTDAALPAFEELRIELERHGRTSTIRKSVSAAILTVHNGKTEEIMYRLQERRLPDKTLPYAQVRMRERGGLKLVTVEAMVRPGSDYQTEDLTKDDVIRSVLDHYTSRINLG
jgi:hypothetical protein